MADSPHIKRTISRRSEAQAINDSLEGRPVAGHVLAGYVMAGICLAVCGKAGPVLELLEARRT